MTEGELLAQARIYLPKYLSPEKQEDLWRELKSFPRNRHYYSSDPDLFSQLLQGDGWRGFVAIDFHTLSKKTVSGIILSNSCDIAPENLRALPPNILFSPLIRLESYRQLLREAGSSDAYVESLSESIRSQRITSIFYLPAHGDVLQESIAVLNDIHSHPLRDFMDRERSSLFTLNNFAFYLLLLKISIHFSRMQETVSR